MKCGFLSILLAGLAASASLATSTPAGFTDDYDAALARAMAGDKMVFAVFTGSDWCPYCIKLEEEVLSQEAFVTGAKKGYELLFLDFPNDKTRLSKKALVQNPKLKEKYPVSGFPTMMVFDAKGKKVDEFLYMPGGPAPYLKHLAAVRKLAAIRKMKKGAARLKKADAILGASGKDFQKQNLDLVEELLAADPDGTLGYRDRYSYVRLVLPIERDLEGVMKRFDAETRKIDKKMPDPWRAQAMIKTEVYPKFAKDFESLAARLRALELTGLAAAERDYVLDLANSFLTRYGDQK